MTNGQRIQFMYIVGLDTLIKRPEFLHGLNGVDDLIHADKGLADHEVEAVLKANIAGLAAQLERDRPVLDGSDTKSTRPLLIEICRRQFGGDKWDRYHDDYLAEVAERAIEQAHAHAVNEDADREAQRIATREKNLEIIARVSGLGARYLDLFGDDAIAQAAATTLAEQEDEARKEDARRDRSRFRPFDVLRWIVDPKLFSPSYRSAVLHGI